VIENLPDVAYQTLLAVVGVLTVVIAFMKTNSIKSDWKEQSRVFGTANKKLDTKALEQDSKIAELSERIAKQGKIIESEYATKDYVDKSLATMSQLVTLQFKSFKEDQLELKGSINNIERILTDERTQELKYLREYKQNNEKVAGRD